MCSRFQMYSILGRLSRAASETVNSEACADLDTRIGI